MSSSDEDDVPLSSLGTNKNNSRSVRKRSRASLAEASDSDEEQEFQEEEEEEQQDNDDDDEDDEESNYSAPANDDDEEEEEDDGDYEDEDESEDDVPLSALRKSPARVTMSPTPTKSSSKSSSKKPKKSSTKKKKKTTPTSPKKKKKSSSSSSSSSTNSPKKSSSTGLNPASAGANYHICASSELYLKSDKGKLIQHLLCRWWYAMTWPHPDDIPKIPPRDTDALSGFPGLYVYTRGDYVGKILDLRNKATCPNFVNMSYRTAEELKALLLQAIEKQREELRESEGEGTAVEKKLGEIGKWAKKVNASKAEKEAGKVLKAAKLTLPVRAKVEE